MIISIAQRLATPVLAAAVILAVPQAFAATETGKNLVQNGGFEDGGAGWAFSVNLADAGGQVVTNEAHSGKQSFKLTDNSGLAPHVYGRVAQIVRGLEPFTTYRISCFVRGTNAGQAWIGGGPGWYVRQALPKGTFGWTNVFVDYSTGETPPDFELMVLTESQTTALWVDDVRMEAVRADTQQRDATLNRLKSQWQSLEERLTALRASAEKNANARTEPVVQLGFNVAERFLKRTEGGTSALQGGDWTRLQLEEVGTVLDETERNLNALASHPGPSTPQPWPADGPARVRDGLFEAKMTNGKKQPFWFYGYGHFIQIIRDLPNFRGLGASLIQDGAVGPSSMNADGSLGDGAKQMFEDLRTAERDGVKMDWLLSPHYFPDWAFAKEPDVRGGGLGFIGFDIDHPLARKVLAEFADEMCEAMENKPALFTVCLSNEPVYDQSGRTKWGRAEYDAYLEKIHGRIGRLNELYGTRYTNFGEIAPPAKGLKGTTAENRAYYDWVRFNQRHFADWHAWLASLVKKRLPRTPTHAKLMVFNCLDRDKLYFGADPEMFCAATDLAGCDAYAFVNGEKTYNWIGHEFFYDLLYSFRHQPVFNSENHVIPDGAPPNHIPLEASRAQFWQGGLHHQAATTTWVWEEGADTSLSGSIYFRPANVYGAGRAMLELNRFAEEAAAINRLQPRVALLYSPSSIFWEPNYKETILSCYRQLSFMGEPVDFISERELADGRMPKRGWIIAPAATHVTDTAAKALRHFVAKGGHLAAAGENNFGWDEYHQARAAANVPKTIQLPVKPTEKESAAALREMLAANGVELTRMADAATDEAVWGVEFRRAKCGGKAVIEMIAMDGQNHVVRIPVLGGRGAVDLLSGEPVKGGTITLEPMVPRLLEAGGN